MPVLGNVQLPFSTHVHDGENLTLISFVIADTKYNILGTPFFTEHIQNLNPQANSFKFVHKSGKIQNCSSASLST